MYFDPHLLETYRTLLQTTDLQRAYQEFIQLFREIRKDKGRNVPAFVFCKWICKPALLDVLILEEPGPYENGHSQIAAQHNEARPEGG